MWGLDEHLDTDVVTYLLEFITSNLSDPKPPIVDCGTDIHRSEILGTKRKDRSGLVQGHDRSLLEAHEAASAFPFTRRIHSDIDTREDGIEAGNLAGRNLCTHDPETRALGQVSRQARGHRRGHLDMREIVGQFDRFDESDVDPLVLELRLARLEPFCALEGDCDRRTLLHPRPIGEVDSNDGGDQGDEPYDRKSSAIHHDDLRHSSLSVLLPLVRLVTHHCPLSDPKSVADRNSLPPTG